VKLHNGLDQSIPLGGIAPIILGANYGTEGLNIKIGKIEK